MYNNIGTFQCMPMLILIIHTELMIMSGNSLSILLLASLGVTQLCLCSIRNLKIVTFPKPVYVAYSVSCREITYSKTIHIYLYIRLLTIHTFVHYLSQADQVL